MRFVIAFVILVTGCSNAPQPPQKKVETPKAVEVFHVDPATAAAVKGKIVFRGAKPAKTVIHMDTEAGCAKMHAGQPVYDESLFIGKDGALANAFVYIQTGLEGKVFETPAEKVTLDQKGCGYSPHVFGIRAGQTLAVKNSDPVSHNIHPLPKENREWSQQQGPETPDLERKFARPEVMIPIKCDVHKWMRAYAGVVTHPYFAVTGADGAFELHNVPPGDYTIAVWHEKLGERTAQAHVAASGVAAVSFTYE